VLPEAIEQAPATVRDPFAELVEIRFAAAEASRNASLSPTRLADPLTATLRELIDIVL
jgi:hypothetical protein